MDGEKSSTLMDTPVLSLERERCVRMRHAASGCRKCADACGAAAIEIREGAMTVAPARCTHCGACAAACPVDALKLKAHAAPEGAMLEAAKKDGALALRCSQTKEGAPGIGLECLNALSPALLLALFEKGAESVSLTSGDCRACPKKSACSAERLISRTRELARAAGFTPEISLKQMPGGLSLGRRRLFSRLFDKATNPEKEAPVAVTPAKDTFCNPSDDHLTHRIPESHRRLLEALGGLQERASAGAGAAPEEEPEVLFRPRIGSECAGCGLCAAACPTGAIRADRTSGALQLFAKSGACVNCGLCAESCFKKAITIEPETLDQALLGLESLEYEEPEETTEGMGEWGPKLGKMFGSAPIHW